MSNDIYSYIKENFGIEITDYQFKRDYIKEPLLRKFHNYEKPYKKDFEYLYNTLNLSINEIKILLSSTKKFITRCLKYFNIKKDLKKRQEKNEQLFIKKYGVSNPMFVPSIKNKLKNTLINNYGVSNPSYVPEILQKREETNLKHFGVKYSFQSDEVKEKCIKTLKERYNCENISQYLPHKNYMKTIQKEINQKIFNTKRRKNSFKKSIQEDEIYNLLIQKYPDTIRQYSSELYPFNCDFYIPEIDTYIEYQGYFTHGKEPYTETDEQKEIVKLWESKNSLQFSDAIKTWTIRDPLKREIAKKNNLNWIEFFNMNEFMNWYNQIK